MVSSAWVSRRGGRVMGALTLAWLAVAQYLGSANAYLATAKTAVPILLLALVFPLAAAALFLLVSGCDGYCYEAVMEFPLLRSLRRWVEYHGGSTTPAVTAYGGRFNDTSFGNRTIFFRGPDRNVIEIFAQT